MLDAPLGMRVGFLRAIVTAYAAGAVERPSKRNLATGRQPLPRDRVHTFREPRALLSPV
jgi:hypothetical protein